jgi:hypothetical protein
MARTFAEPVLWRDGFFWLTLGLTLFAVAPFLLPGYFWGANDARHHVYFLFEFNRSVQDGIWWPRWSPDFAFGYGYPFFNIYGPLSHFIAQLLLHFLGFSYTAAIEAVFVLSIVASAGAMYAFVRSWGGRQAALVAALVYTYIPYHLLNLYVRANLAESMAFVWMPLLLWTVRQAALTGRYRWVAGAAFSYAGLLLTSNLVFVLFTPLLGLYWLVVTAGYSELGRAAWRQPAFWYAWLRRAAPPVVGLVLGLGLSAIFLLPMVTERQYVRVDQWFDGRYSFAGHFVYFFQLFSPQWGFGASQAGPDDPIGFQLGVAAFVLAVLGTLRAWSFAGRLRWEIACLLVVGLGATFLTLTWSAPLWDLPLIGAILGSAQFPWRWFSIAAVALSALAGLLLLPEQPAEEGTPALNGPLVALIVVILLSSYSMLEVELSEPAEGPVGLPALMRFQQSSDEMTGSTAWVKEIPTWSGMADIYISRERNGEVVDPLATMVDYSVVNYNRTTGFVVHSQQRTSVMEEVFYWSPLPGRRIVYNQFYYPGWRAYLLDGPGGTPVEELAVIPEEDGPLGRMTVPVPPGEGYVQLRFEDTPPRTIGRAISVVTLALLLLAGVLLRILKYRRQPA